MAGNQSNEITALLWFDVFSLPPVVMFAMYFGGSGHLPRTCNSTSKVWALIYILGSACISHVHAGSFKDKNNCRDSFVFTFWRWRPTQW